MDSYILFLGIAATTIVLPGPGVVMTINNATRHGFISSLIGAIGISLGVLVVAAISATGLGVLLTQSATAFTALKYVGALYLIYLGVKVWRTKGSTAPGYETVAPSASRHVLEGVLLSLSNPKSIVFFVAIFPQFLDTNEGLVPQLVLLAGSFGVLVLIIHGGYAATAVVARKRIVKSMQVGLMNKISGGLLVTFGFGLAASRG